MNELALFAGAGGGILAGSLLGWRTVCAVEIDAYCASVLVARQNDGTLPAFPIWDDIRSFDGSRWRGVVDVISGGFPCTDISDAGTREGIHGKNSSLWFEMARIIREVRPRYVFVENTPTLIVRGLGAVLGELAASGYDARWLVLGADDLGAPHKRDRIWIAAKLRNPESHNSDHGAVFSADRKGGNGESSMELGFEQVSDSDNARTVEPKPKKKEGTGFSDNSWWKTEPAMDRVANGMAYRIHQVRVLGNGQVPVVAAAAWRELTKDW